MDLTTAVEKLQRLIQNQDINFDSSPDVLNECVERAVVRYGIDSEHRIKVDLSGNDTGIISLPAGVVDDCTKIVSVEYPVGENPPEYIEKEDWGMYKDSSGDLELRLYKDAPETGKDIRIEINEYINLVDNVPEKDEWALLYLSAYYACIVEAQKAGNTVSEGEALDFVEFTTSSDRYEEIGKEYLSQYLTHMFGSEEADKRKSNEGAMSLGRWGTDSRYNRPRIFHVEDTD